MNDVPTRGEVIRNRDSEERTSLAYDFKMRPALSMDIVVDDEVVTSVLVADWGEGYFLWRLHTVKSFRRLGYARAVLERVIEMFGKENPLFLQPITFESGSIDKEELRAFYESFGFEDAGIEDYEDLMVRKADEEDG